LTTIVQNAWERKQALAIHGWVYGLKDGLVRHLGISLSNPDELAAAMKTAWEKGSASLQDA
jgi:carbonic anhydrase